MNRNTQTRLASAPARPARATALRGTAARYQPKKRGVLGRIFRWFLFLSIVGSIVASFFVKAGDGKTYADLYTIPAYQWVKAKIFPPETETETETAKKDAVPAAPSELDTKFNEAVSQREKAEAAKLPDAADEAVAFLEKALDATARRIDAVREVGLEAAKAASRKTRVATAQIVEELAAQARVQKDIAAALMQRKSTQDVKAALAAVPPPPPPPPAAPPVVSYDLRKLHAWPAQPVGTWVRWKKTVGETVSYEDHVLVTLTDEAAVVRIEAVPGNQATADRVFVFGADKAHVLREETVKLGEVDIPCRVIQSGSTLRWIPKEVPGVDHVALKVQTGDQTIVVTELAEEEVPVKGQAKKCLKYAAGEVTVWGHEEVPGFAVRVKTGNETAEAIEWGADPAARPATPTPAPKNTAPAPAPTPVAAPAPVPVPAPAPAPASELPAPAEERPVKALLADAEQLTLEGVALLREVIEAMKNPPEALETLKALLSKAESASSLLVKAREGFVSAKEKAPDPASIVEKISKLGRALDLAAKQSESIKSRLR
jgi:hypothetical protein